jgi:formyl-CoA transferase
MGRPELGDDPRYATHVARGQHQQELDDLISAWTAEQGSQELELRLNDHAVPNGRAYTAADMLSDPHYAAREAIVRLAHPLLGDFPMQNVVPKLSETPGVLRWVGPELGEHTEQVLIELLGRSPEEVEELRRTGVV